MAQVASVIDVYDFENVIESAAKEVLVAAGIANVYAGADAGMDRAIPRVEVIYQHGAEMQSHELLTEAGDTPIYEPVCNAWRGTLSIQPIVASGNASELATMRAKCRDVAARWKKFLMVSMPHHLLIDCVGAGAQPMFATDRGLWACTLRYTISFRLRDNALNELNQAQNA